MIFNKEDIKSILSVILDSSIESITDDIPLAELGYDSLKFISTIVEIESKYNIEIRDSDLLLDNFKNVLSISKTLEKYFESDQKLYKCAITDCDGVLWHGIAGESGNDQALSDGKTEKYCTMLHRFREKGVLLAICSKNNKANIDTMLGITSVSTDDFAIIETNVTDKSESISYILNEFGFTADNAIYVDDSDGEIGYLKSKMPELTIFKADYSDDFTEKLSTAFSSIPELDAIDRTVKYREQKSREVERKRTNSPDEYNLVLETKTICEKAKPQDVSRLVELSQRANRFNLTGAKYAEDEVENMLHNNSYSIYKLCAEDKFGDMGLVAMAVVHDNIIESFIVSCRVFGRGFETELLKKIQTDYSCNVKGSYLPTGKNDYCKNFYYEHGVTYELR